MTRSTSQHSPEWLATAETARRLGVSTRTVLRLEERGQLKPRRLPSGHRRYLAAEVDALLDGDERDAP